MAISSQYMSASNDRSGQAVIDFCQRVADGLDAAGNCPCCATVLNVEFSIQGVRVSCPTGCFCFDFRRDLRGAFVSGLLDFPVQGQETALRTLA